MKPAYRIGSWIVLGTGLLLVDARLVATSPLSQGIQPIEVRAERQSEGQEKAQEKTPEERAREQAASRPLLGKPSTKARQPGESPNVMPKWPFTKPFRYFNPIQHSEPNKEIQGLLARLDYARALYLKSKKRGTDAHGRPIIQDNDYLQIIQDIRPRLKNMQAYLIYLIRDHAKGSYRRAAHFGALFLADMRQTFEVISYAPCEPNRDIRHFAMLMGAPMLRKYLPWRGPEAKPVTVDPKSKEAKPPYTYVFISDPYLNLLRAPTIEERLYALSFLRIMAATRPDQTAEQMRRMEAFFLDGLKSSNKDIAKVTRYVINDLAIATRAVTEIEADCPEKIDEAALYFHKLMRKLFPDIRIRGGLVELHDGDQLRKVLTELEGLCKEGKIGFRDSVQIGEKGMRRTLRGLRLREYDALKSMGLEAGLLVTAINGTPVLAAAEVPDLIAKMLTARQHTFAVTFVDPAGKERVLQYRYKAKQ